MLTRWENVANLTPWERDFLVTRGFGSQLVATRWRPPKLSAKAKAELLIRELVFRGKYVEELRKAFDSRQAEIKRDDSSKPIDAPFHLLAPGELAATDLLADADSVREALAAIMRRNPKLLFKLPDLPDEARPGPLAFAEERFQGLRDELGGRFVAGAGDLDGAVFVAGTVYREARVRKWTERLREHPGRELADSPTWGVRS